MKQYHVASGLLANVRRHQCKDGSAWVMLQGWEHRNGNMFFFGFVWIDLQRNPIGNHRKTIENHGKTMGKPWEHGGLPSSYVKIAIEHRNNEFSHETL